MNIPRPLAALAALAVCGATVTMAAPAQADTTIGFSTTATATPVRIEIYEPSIPIPAEPQAELNLSYTKVEGASGPSVHGRASWLWPGDPVGEGLKTFGETLGLPEPLYANGYTVQSNSYYPGDQADQSQSDDTVPGAVQSTTAGETKVVAKVGFSPDGDIPDGDGSSGSGSGSGSGLPLPLGGGLDSLTSPLSSALGGSSKQSAGTTSGSSSGQQISGAGILPPEVSALVDFGGSNSVSRATYEGDTVTSYASSRMHDLSLLGGLITMDSLNVTTKVVSSLDGAKPTYEAHFVGLAVAGQEIKVTKDGVEAVGQKSPALGLPADPNDALAQIGVSFELPTAQKSVNGNDGSIAIQGLKLVVDVHQLHSYLDQLPLNDLVDQVPDIPGWPEQAPTLKSILQTAVNAKPRIVILLGNATSAASAVPPITIDPCLLNPTGCDTSTPGLPTGAGPGAGPGTSSDLPVASGPLGGDPVPTGEVPTTTEVQNVAAGLPPLNSIPTMLLLAGLVVASAVGWWLQRIGATMLGAAGACSHGAETGIPDLRKV
jgi:hypothetical protein